MTYKARLWTAAECHAELRFLASINPTAPGAMFRHDPASFARYANMQANHMRASGHLFMAHDAAQIRDVANPEFRAEAREAGWFVNGAFAYESHDSYLDIEKSRRASYTA